MKKNNKLRVDAEVKNAVLIPKVSVIMPIYNAQKFLDEAIQSILKQTFKDFELLLINDGSTDGSEEIIEKYRNDNRVRIFHKKNEGVTKTLNFGLAQSVGRYVARMDADDISMPERLELQVDFLDEHRNVGLLGTRFKAITEDGKFIENLDVELTNEELQEKLIKSCRFGHPTVMMRRSAIESVGSYDESSWANTVEDYDLWLRIAEKFEIANLSQYLLHYRINSNSITQTKKEINEKGTLECIRRARERRGSNSSTLVSICIPSYKQPELLKKALESILLQSHKNYEVVITDDSPDDSVEDVYNDFKKYTNIRYIRNKERKGTPENWNESIKHANGEYIKILHHDDWFPEQDSLAKFVKMLDENPRADFAFSGSLNFNPEGALQFTHTAKQFQIKRLKKDPKFLFVGNFIGAPSATIFRRTLDLYFDTQFRWVVDIDFYIRALKKNIIFEYTAEPLVAIRMMSNDQVTADCVNDKAVQISEYLNLYEKISYNSNVNPYQFGYLWCLLERFKIKSLKNIRECGYEKNIPVELIVILFFQQNIIIQSPLLLLNKIYELIIFVIRSFIVRIAFIFAYIRKMIAKE
jgi:glycosyltransferase involved in cell wall biosynthesis